MSSKAKGKGGGSGSKGPSYEDAFADEKNKGPALKPSSEFVFEQEDLDVLNAHVVSSPDEDNSKAAQEWRQMKDADRNTIQSETRRFIVLKSLSGSATIKAAELAAAVLKPGLYGNPKSIKGTFLIQKVSEQLKSLYGIQMVEATDGLTQGTLWWSDERAMDGLFKYPPIAFALYPAVLLMCFIACSRV